MPDRTVVADVIAGHAAGFGAAYDQYAVSLYGYCRSMLPEGEAAEAVLDTFLVAAAKLDGLDDPGRLGAWLQAVARNECLRRLGPAGAQTAGQPSAKAGGEFAAATLPVGFRETVLAACTDNTPAGRARRASVAHRAGAFDQAGFPRAIRPARRHWRHRHPGLASLAALLVPLAVALGVAAVLAAGSGPHRPAATVAAPGTTVPDPLSSTVPGHTPPAVPARQVTATAGPTPSASASVPAGVSSSATPPGPGSPSSPSPTSASASASASPSPSPSPSSSPAPGYLLVMPGRLSLTAKAGTAVSGSFKLTAVNGPVAHFTIQVAGHAGQVSVSPGGGSLPAGGMMTVTVTVTSKVALTIQVMVEPNGGSVTVTYKPGPTVTPTPTSTPVPGGGDRRG